MITSTQLREKLGITQPALTQLVRDGLPCHEQGRKKLFDPAEVAQWLVDNERAVIQEEPRAQAVARTRQECAEHFGVHLRTLATWLEDETFPGRAGTRGRRDGYFPLDEILTWIRERDATRVGGPRLELDKRRGELMDIKIRRETRIERKEAGELAPIADMVELVQRLTNAAKQILESIPDEAAKDLPEDLGDDVKARIVRRWRKRISEVERVISEAIAGDSDSEDE